MGAGSPLSEGQTCQKERREKMKGEQASRRRGKSQGLAAQRGRGWSDGKLTGKGAVSEAGLVGRRSCWDRGASGWDAVGKHHPEESQGWGEQGPPGFSPYLPPGHSQVALVVIVFLILVFVRILTDWLWGERHRVSRAQGGPWPPPSQGRQDRRRTLVLVAGHTVGCQESARGKSTQLRWAWALPGPSPWAPRPAYHHLSPAGKKACGGSLRGAAGIA